MLVCRYVCSNPNNSILTRSVLRFINRACTLHTHRRVYKCTSTHADTGHVIMDPASLRGHPCQRYCLVFSMNRYGKRSSNKCLNVILCNIKTVYLIISNTYVYFVVSYLEVGYLGLGYDVIILIGRKNSIQKI